MDDLGERRIDRHWWNETDKPTEEVTNEQAQAWLVRSDDAGRLSKALLESRAEVTRLLESRSVIARGLETEEELNADLEAEIERLRESLERIRDMTYYKAITDKVDAFRLAHHVNTEARAALVVRGDDL